MLKFYLTILFLGYVGGIIPPGILETVHHFFSGFPYSPKIQELENEINDYIFPAVDFLVIGAGSAGSVIANRLTENPDWKVLVLEQGEDEIFLTDIPFLAPFLYITNYARVYKSEPRPQDTSGHGGYCLSMVDGRCNIVSGKAVGGTSVVNFMIYSRGSPADFDGWAALNNPGWSYEEVLPYFIKSEKCMLMNEDARFHGYHGYLDVTNLSYATTLKEHWLEAGQELGYNLIDYNSDRLVGFSTLQVTLRNGHRVSASKAFLRPIRGRANLYLSKLSTVTKIVINPTTKRAVGVEFVKNDRTYFVTVSKEIILSAGALSSPQLLMLSGIGPKDHLSIRVIEDLPVGFNLQDHVSMSGLVFLVNENVSTSQQRLTISPTSFLDYLIRGNGPLTVPNIEGLAFINTKANLENVRENNKRHDWNKKCRGHTLFLDAWIVLNATFVIVNHDILKIYANKNKSFTEDDYPDIELLFSTISLATDTFGVFNDIFAISKEFHKEVYSGYEDFDSFTIIPVLLRPKSRGRITLRNTDPLDSPIIDLNYYDDEDDLNTMVQGLKMAIKVASTEAFKRYNTTLLSVPLPGCKHIAFNSDPYWACVARHMSTCIFHFSGTCKMSTRKNSGVVDHRLRVHGISGLRVVDASIMPTIIAGHTTAPTYMIAEKASDMIKEDWKVSAP
ncbi:glucose dehydrogenase [FAD, quinone]-like [Anoplolepis gracilipes]|uniref:glucose dehydrogenase [FAD, quinone]-like n=1 Tax=Anoplolepis gracilipes TaxID=354296 RepID=UPI003B9F6996